MKKYFISISDVPLRFLTMVIQVCYDQGYTMMSSCFQTLDQSKNLALYTVILSKDIQSDKDKTPPDLSTLGVKFE